MGGILELLAGLTLLGIVRERDAREEERNSRQEEEFVPFNIFPLGQQGEATDQPMAEEGSVIAVPRGISHAPSMP